MEIRNNFSNSFAIKKTSFLNEVRPDNLQMNTTYANSQASSSAARAYATPQISFGNKYDKLIQEIKSKSPGKIHLSFDEGANILERFGFHSKGNNGSSHIQFSKEEHPPILIVKPHGGHNCLAACDVKKIQALC